MQSARFSIRALLATLALVGIAAAALSNASPFVAALTTSSVIVVLLVSVLAGINLQDSSRAFWLGFAICGWSYLFLIYGWTRLSDGNSLTTELLWQLADVLGGNGLTEVEVEASIGVLYQTPIGQRQ